MNYTFTILTDEPHSTAPREPQAMAGRTVQSMPASEATVSVTRAHRQLAQFLSLFRRPSKPKRGLGPI